MNGSDPGRPDRRGTILSTAVAALDAERLTYERLADTDILAVDWTGTNGVWTCFLHARERDAQLLVYSVLAGPVPVERRAAIAEFLTRVNYYMPIGNFEMDYDSGEVRYKTSVAVEGDRLSVAMARQLLRLNIATMDLFLPGIGAVIRGDGTPAEVIAVLQ